MANDTRHVLKRPCPQSPIQQKAAPSFTDEAASLLQFRIILELLLLELQSLQPLLRVPQLLLLEQPLQLREQL